MTTRSAATLIRAFAAVRGLLYATGFVALWWWVVASVRPLDSRFTLELPAWVRVPGLVLAALGVVLAFSCVAAFALAGKGTPAPFDPPRVVVAVGPYRWVRNPMYLGAVAVICGAGLYLRSLGAIVVAAFFILLAHALVLLYEEPILEERFGESYLRYKKSVPRWVPRRPVTAVMMVLVLASCASTGGSSEPNTRGASSASESASSSASASTSSSAPASAPTPVPEVRPGFLAGYLPIAELPDSLALVPPPPAADTAAKAADVEAYRITRPLRGTARWELATQDADLTFPNAAGTYSCALGAPITESATPHLYTLLRRTLTDGGAATGAAKRKYVRKRPFVELAEASCSPGDEGYLRNDGSYPSGHSSLGWAWALLLAELAPDRDDAVLARGFAYGQSRVVCGVHWQSDVNAGRVVGAGVVARLHDDPGFRADFEAARKELAAVRAQQLQPSRDCAAEAAALAVGAP
jgi:acid phosphatase (class A)